MKLNPVNNKHRLFRLLSMIWLLTCLIPQSIAATGKQGSAATKSEKMVPAKPPISFQQVESFPALVQSGKLKIDKIPNPHWNKNGCIACHKSNRINAGIKNIRHKKIEQTCYNCHSPAFDHRYIHPASVRPDKKMLANMDPVMRTQLAKSKNTINCTTCHDLSMQCLASTRQQKLVNPKFFRNGPFDSRSQLCFLCHDKNQFQRLNPHDQIDQQGKLLTEKCRICHADTIERLNQVTDIAQLEFNATKSLSSMCWGCHPWTPHPGGQFTFFKNKSGPDHLTKPPENIKNRLDEMTEKNQVVFPLEPESGKVFCGTCHNVHEKGVIKNPEKARGADSKKRLREQKICEYCHLK